jgi:hypothetical protein
MADQSEKGIQQSGGIMVNYLYRYASIGLLLLFQKVSALQTFPEH